MKRRELHLVAAHLRTGRFQFLLLLLLHQRMRGNAINMSLKLWSTPSTVGRWAWAICFPELYFGDSHLSPLCAITSSDESNGFYWPFWGITGLPLHPERQIVDWRVTSLWFPLKLLNKHSSNKKKKLNYYFTIGISPHLRNLLGLLLFSPSPSLDLPNLVNIWQIVLKQLWTLKDIKLNCLF